MSTLEQIQAPISNILKQLVTAQKGFGELKDFIKSSKEHKLLYKEMRDLELFLKAVQSAIAQESPSSSNVEIQELFAKFNASLDEFIQGSQALATSILGIPSKEVNSFSITVQTFKRQITTQFPDDILAKYREDPTQIPRSEQAGQEPRSINVTAHGGTGGAGGHGGKQGGLGGRGEGAQLTFNNTNTVYLAAKILDWLSTLNFYQRQDAILETWQEGTGQWFFSLLEFKDWLLNSEKVLWCEGPPGAGKTVLSSLVVKHIENSVQNSDVGLAYIYINHKELGNQSPTALFASLCKQLLLNKPLPLVLQDLWQYHSTRNTQPTLDNTLRVLEVVLLEYSSVYLVIDALDEYLNTTHEQQAVFIQSIVRLIKQFPIHLMITTRPNNISQSRFSNIQLVSITAEKADITLYIENRFNHSDNLCQLLENRPQLKTDIQLAIAQDVDGIFLLTKLRIDHLGAQPTVASLQEALKTLPSTLTAAYEVTMTRINTNTEGFRMLAHKALMWVTHAVRPLSVAELCEAIAIDNADTCLNREKVPEIRTILAICNGLVTIDKELSVVRLVHYTAQDWLGRWFPNAHKEIALTSFQYMNFPVFRDLAKLDEETDSFVVYTQYCLEHTRRTNCEMEFITQVEQFACRAHIWRRLWWSLSWSKRIPFWKHELWPYGEHDCLILAAAANLQDVTRYLLKEVQADIENHETDAENYDSDTEDYESDTVYEQALSLAAYAGHSEIVKLLLDLDGVNSDQALCPAICGKQTETVKMLLDKGADVNTVDERDTTALHNAIDKGFEPIIKMLLDAGADTNIIGGMYGTALQAAASIRDEHTVKMLLDAGADMNIVIGEYGTALHIAVHLNSEPVVKVLLEAGADMNIIGGKYGTALQAAVYRESGPYDPIVKMLLDAGANMNIVGGSYGTVLRAAAYRAFEPTVKMLLDAGAEVNLVCNECGTALQLAAMSFWGPEPIVKMLLDAGADMNIICGDYGTVLQTAAYRRSEALVKMLLDAGADVNIVGGKYGTALQASAYSDSKPIVKMLLDNRADVNIVSGEYGTALQAAAYSRSKPVIKMLLEAGADTNIVCGDYGTALQTAAYRRSEALVKMLLDAGADVNIVGGKYGTALQASAYSDSKPIVKMLLNKGADVNIVSGQYGTALQAAAYSRSEHIVKILLEAGADTNIVCGNYGTALQAAAYRGSEPSLRMLLDAGADINILGGGYGTALQAAAYNQSMPIVNILLDAGADMNMVGGKYGTALQAAVAWNEPESQSIVKHLLNAGADANLTGGTYGSALNAAKALDLPTIEQMLLQAGAIATNDELVRKGPRQKLKSLKHLSLVQMINKVLKFSSSP
ncbi:ANK-REP-region domain-containing protein [Favolaschia claudopus]|uniref:ANK-REP-region domain-containing protein n=1 Tax=Favolaschia claudopus TaxID=2862362 RepID=A0AAW0DJL1_9AGAR